MEIGKRLGLEYGPPTRNAFGEVLKEIGGDNPNLVVLDGDLGQALHLAAEAVLRIILGEDDARTAGPEGLDDLFSVVPDAGDDPQARDDDPSHSRTLSRFGGREHHNGYLFKIRIGLNVG